MLCNKLAAAIATIVLLAVAAPSAAYADAFKPAMGNTKTAGAKIAKTRGFVGLDAVLVGEGRVGSARYGVACGDGPRGHVSSRGEAHERRSLAGAQPASLRRNPDLQHGLLRADLLCTCQERPVGENVKQELRSNQQCGALYFNTRASRARCSSARRVLIAFFNRGGTEHPPGHTRTVGGWKCKFLRYYEPGAAAYRCRLRENPRRLAVAYWSGDYD